MVTICCQKNGMKSDVLDGMFTKCLITIGIVLLLLQSSLAAHDKEQAGHAAPPQDLAVSSHLSLPSSGAVTGARAGPGQGAEAKLRSVEEGEALPSLPPALEAPRQPSAFSLVLTMAEREIQASGRSAGVLSKSTLTKASPSSSKASTSSAPPSKTTSSIYSSSNNDNKTAWPDGASLHPLTNSTYNFSSESELVSSLPAWDLPTVPESSLSTLGDNDVTLPANVTSPFSKHQWNTTSPARDVNYIPNINYSLTTPSPANTRVSTSPSTTTSAGNTFPAVLTTYKPSHPYTNQNTVTNASLQLTTITISTPLTMTVTSPQPILWAVSRGASTTPEDMGTINTATTTQLTSTAKHLIMATASTTNTEPVATTLTSSTMATSTTTITTTTQPHSTLPATPPSSTLTYTTAATTISTTVALTTSATTNINATTELPTITLAVPVKTTPIPTVTIAEPHPSSTAESEESPAPCNITKKNWIRTVLSIQLRRNRLDLVLKQNLLKGLNHALQRALNDSSATAQVEHDECSPHNVTLGYYVVTVKMVYMSSVVVKAVGLYGFEKLLADIRQHTALVKAILVPVANWLPSPSTHYQLKTVLRFVGPTDKVLSCSFVQMLEERLTNAFEEAQDKVLETYNKLRVEIQSVTQESGFPSVSVVYVVKNDNVFLNGTISSGLLNQLTAELVGYFLFYPPLVIAEPLEYHNLNTSAATKNYWVITVLQDVDSFSLEENYHSFASLMEQRLAELFVVAGRQGTTRVRRATTIEGYTVQMVSILRLSGPKNPAELTYYVQLKGTPIRGTVAAKTLSTLDSQTMALTLGHFVQLQAQPVVNTPSSRLWIIAVVTPMTLVMVVVIMLMFILCKKNRLLFKASSFKTFKTRSKTSYRRDGSYHHQPVQGFDYAKQHMGRAGEETVAVTKETLTLGLPVRDAPLSLDKKAPQDGTVNKRPPSADIHKGGRLPSEEGSVSSSGSGKLNTGKSSSARGTAAAKNGKDELHKRNDPYEDHTSSLRLISIKPMLAQQPTYSYPSSSSHSQDSVIVNGESVLGLKQKSDIEQYRNKLRQKARRKGYGEFSLSENGSHAYSQRDRKVWHNNIAKEPMTAEEKRASFAGCHKRYSQPREATYWSRQSLSSPSPVEAEMDLLVLRERSRRGIRNNGYDDEPEPFEETNLDRLMSSLGYSRGGTIGRGSVGIRGHRGSDSSTISSQPSTDEVQTQMHMLLGNAFAMGPPDHDPPSPPIHRKNYQNRNHHHHAHSVHNPSHTSPYSEGVTSAPGTMNHPRGGCQRSSGCGPDKNQCSLPKPGFRFTQLPDMGVGSPPPLIPSRPGPHSGTSLRRSTPDVTVKPRLSTEASEGQHNATPYLPLSRAPFPAVTVDQSMTTYSGNPMTAVYAISANRPGYSDYFVMSPPSSYRSPSWMSYPPEPEDIPQQWNDTPVLPGPEGPGSFSFPIYTKTV